MNIYYEHMPEDFKKAVEIIMQYCQNEDCDCDCNECPYTLAEIRCGDVIRSEIPNTCEDAISRQATLEKFKKTYFDNETVIRCAELVINGMPSVTPQQRTGRWRKVSMDKYIQHATYYYECSECGDQHIGQVNYCPNCGCKMEVEE